MGTVCKYKKHLSAGLIALLIFAVYYSVQLSAAGTLMQWKKKDTMTNNLEVVENKAGREDILLELDVEDTGTYTLTYNLEDKRQTQIKMIQSYSKLVVEYHLYEKDASNVTTEITQAETKKSYLEMDYAATVPDWKFDGNKTVGASGGLEYEIIRSASTRYPGIAINVNNKKLYVKWDFNQNKAYVLIDDYEAGKIMPIAYNTPTKGSEAMKVLKQLEGFDVKATHYVKSTTNPAINVQVNPIKQPNSDSDKPGGKPGLDITFKQPKELNTTSWAYEYGTTDLQDAKAIIELDDLGTDAYYDFSLNLQKNSDRKVGNLDLASDAVNNNVVYSFDNNTYTIHLVKSKTDLAAPTKNNFIEWPELASSSLYKIKAGVQVSLGSASLKDYEFVDYQPTGGFAATYMEYILERSSVKEAYLDITPFNGGDKAELEYTILYSKTEKNPLEIDADLWLKNYHTASDRDSKIFIPVPFQTASSQDYYQVVITFSGTQIFSQVLNYRAVDDTKIPPTVPEIKAIEDIFVVPPLTGTGNNPEKVQMDITWTAPTNKTQKELETFFTDDNGNPNDNKLYYELYVNTVPQGTTADPFQVIKVFEVKRTGTPGNYAYTIEAHTTDATGEVGSSESGKGFIGGYDKTDERFRMDNVVLWENGRWANVITTNADTDKNTYTITKSAISADFAFPGVNYLRIRAVAMKDGKLSTSDMSIPDSVTLALNNYSVPMVDTMSYKPLGDNVTQAGITLSWDKVNTNNFQRYMLTPLGKTIQKTLYTVYLAEEKAKILPLDATKNKHNILRSSPVGAKLTLTPAELAMLRNGEVAVFSVEDTGAQSISTVIEGMDANKSYHLRIVTDLEIDAGDKRSSLPSSVLSITIPEKPEGPGSELRPLTPETLTVTPADDTGLNALLKWVMPKEMTFAPSKHGFEIIALEDRALPTLKDEGDLSVQEIVDHEDLKGSVVEGWRLYKIADGTATGKLVFEKYNPATKAYEAKDLKLVSQDNNTFTMIDDANGPNKVNYYYVRTVKMDATTAVAASLWARGTMTTAPVKSPINLTVDYQSPYTFLPKEQFIIRFDAPVPSAAEVGTNYIMEIHIKGEDDTDYSVVKYPATYMGTNGEAPDGYVRLFYKINGLKPGKTYAVKVRVEDRTKPKEVVPGGGESYPKSGFSDIATSRTEFDQESYDKEQKYKEYLDYYQLKAEELRKLIYFKIRDSKDEVAVKYREDYSEGIIQLRRNSDLKLYTGNKATTTYYLPSNAVAAINDLDVTLVLENKNQQVGMRPDTVGVRITNEINSMIEKINQYNSTDKDWYLRIKVFTDTYNGKINGLTPAGPLVEVQLAVVGSKAVEEDVDAKMEAQLDTVIKSKKPAVIKAIEAELAKGINDTLILKAVEKVVKEVEGEYLAQAAILFNGYLNNNATAIKEIKRPLYVALQSNDQTGSHGVYSRNNNSWKFEPSNYSNDHYYVETTVLKPYITLPTSQNTKDLKAAYGQDAVDVINAYDLTSIFSSYDLSHPDEAVDKYQWLSATARLMGARAGEDTPDWLTRRDIFVSTLNMQRPMSYEESLMTYLDVYAARHNLDMATVHISDYSIIDDINEVTQAYRLPLIRGANIGLIPLKDSRLNPKNTLKVKDAMTLLTTLHKGND